MQAVLTNYFSVVGLDYEFRIAARTIRRSLKMRLLRKRILIRLFNELIAQKGLCREK